MGSTDIRMPSLTITCPPGGPLLWYPPLFSLQLFEQSSKKSIHTTRIELKLPRHVAHVTAFDFGIVPRAVLA